MKYVLLIEITPNAGQECLLVGTSRNGTFGVDRLDRTLQKDTSMVIMATFRDVLKRITTKHMLHNKHIDNDTETRLNAANVRKTKTYPVRIFHGIVYLLLSWQQLGSNMINVC